ELSTSGGFLNDLLTPAVRFSPWVTLLLGPIAPMVSSDRGRGLTAIPVTHQAPASELTCRTLITQEGKRSSDCFYHTSSNHFRLVLLISDLFLLNVSSWEEKAHHPFKELIHELDGERNHVHLKVQRRNIKIKCMHHWFDTLTSVIFSFMPLLRCKLKTDHLS
uniref:Uncharacterized protein n=1 Tax=Nothobranchius furzeri TaxID=105023 RepID=A0A8C6NJK4_NOTFU